MNKQIIFCLETNKRADTDWVYINETIKRFYRLSNKIHLEREYLNGKMNYNSKGILKDIAKKTKEYRIGKTQVIYCIDVDDFENNQDHVHEFDEIHEFCSQNGYELIWFCHDVEDVFLGERIHNTEKTKSAATFRQRKRMDSVDEKMLRSVNCHKVHSSNILAILDGYLE